MKQRSKIQLIFFLISFSFIGDANSTRSSIHGSEAEGESDVWQNFGLSQTLNENSQLWQPIGVSKEASNTAPKTSRVTRSTAVPSTSTQIPVPSTENCDLGADAFSDESLSEPERPRPAPKTVKMNRILKQRRKLNRRARKSLRVESQEEIDKDPNYNPDLSSMSTTTDESTFSFETPEKRKKNRENVAASAEKRHKGVVSSTPIPVVEIPDDDDEIPDFEDQENEEQTLKVLTPNTINEKYKSPKRKTIKGVKKKLFQDCTRKTRENNESDENRTLQENADEIVVVPEINETGDNDDIVEVKVKSSRRPGKGFLLEKLRSILEASDDDEIGDEEILNTFEFKSTKFNPKGFPVEHCPCKAVKDELKEMFEIVANIATGGDYKRQDICPKCFVIFINSGKNDYKKNFLQMIYQVCSFYFICILILPVRSCILILNHKIDSRKE